MAENHRLMWKVDFIERENFVIIKAQEILKGKKIISIEIFREFGRSKEACI